MKTTLITGGIASGKSEVCRYLSGRGLPVYDCDSRCKALYDNLPGFRDSLEKELGLPFDRWSEIFSDAALRRRLEDLVFPALVRDIRSWKDSLKAPRCFIESATALDKPELSGLWDDVWLVSAAYEVRMQRNCKVAERACIQHYDVSLSDELIVNDGTLEELYKKIDRIL